MWLVGDALAEQHTSLFREVFLILELGLLLRTGNVNKSWCQSYYLPIGSASALFVSLSLSLSLSLPPSLSLSLSFSLSPSLPLSLLFRYGTAYLLLCEGQWCIFNNFATGSWYVATACIFHYNFFY